MIFIQCANVTRYSQVDVAMVQPHKKFLTPGYIIQCVNMTRYSPVDVAMIQPNKKTLTPWYSFNVLLLLTGLGTAKLTWRWYSHTQSSWHHDISFSVFNVTRYSPGDVAMIQPQNIEECVEQFLAHMGLDGSQTFYLQQNDSGLLYLLLAAITIGQFKQGC